MRFGETNFSVDLADGRTITVPIEWFPRLARATIEQRPHARLIGGENPYDPDPDKGLQKLHACLDAGITCFAFQRRNAPLGRCRTDRDDRRLLPARARPVR